MSWKILHAELGGFRSWCRVKTPAHGECYVCVPPKCGWTSFRHAVNPATLVGANTFSSYMRAERRGMYGPHQVAQRTGKKFLAVRDPVDRFSSLYRQATGNAAWARKQLLPERMTPDELLDIIRATPLGNVHWYPVAGYLVTDAVLVPFDRLLSELGYKAVHKNRGPVVADLRLPEYRIRAHYARDDEIYTGALRSEQSRKLAHPG